MAPIDAVGIDRDGEIYLVETKLYKNPDKRNVVAQVLDYGASLWKSHSDFDNFLLQLNSHVQKQFGQSMTDKVSEYYGLDDDALQVVLERMKNNLNEGNFKFVVLMDSIHDQLKDLILYMNQNSKFDIYGVELEYYQHESFEIMIPKLFGAEVKKDIGSRKVNIETVITDEEFIQAFDPNAQPTIQEVIDLSKKIQSGAISLTGLSSRKSPKNINFYFTFANNEKNALTVTIGVNGGVAGKTLDFWCNNPDRQHELVQAIQSSLEIPAELLSEVRKYGIMAKWDLGQVDTQKLITLFENLSQINQ